MLNHFQSISKRSKNIFYVTGLNENIINNYKDIHHQSYNKTIQTNNIPTIKTNLQKIKCHISNNLKRHQLEQEPITRSLHLPHKPLESTFSDEKLFIEIVFAQNLSRMSAYCRSEKKKWWGKLTNKFTSCSITAFFYMFYPFQCTFTGKPVLKIILCWRWLTQGYSTYGGSG